MQTNLLLAVIHGVPSIQVSSSVSLCFAIKDAASLEKAFLCLNSLYETLDACTLTGISPCIACHVLGCIETDTSAAHDAFFPASISIPHPHPTILVRTSTWFPICCAISPGMFSGNDFLKSLQRRAAIDEKHVKVDIVRPSGASFSVFGSTEIGVGGSVWEAASVLADHLELKHNVEGKRILELGSGTGVLGLCLAVAGAASVTLTDRFDVISLLKRSAAENASLNVNVQELNWGELCAELSGQQFDWIVASEVIYNGNLYEKLLASIREFCGPDSIVFMSYERRSSEALWVQKMESTFGSVVLEEHVVKDKHVAILTCKNLIQ